jgi:hypothetical protein
MTPTTSTRTGHETGLRIGLAILGIATVLTSMTMFVDPAGFIDGAVNEHLVRDLSTWTVVYGAALLFSVWRPSWRVPVLSIGVAQGVLHVINHVSDAGLADPAWKGAANTVAFAGLVLVTAALLVAAARERTD